MTSDEIARLIAENEDRLLVYDRGYDHNYCCWCKCVYVGGPPELSHSPDCIYRLAASMPAGTATGRPE